MQLVRFRQFSIGAHHDRKIEKVIGYAWITLCLVVSTSEKFHFQIFIKNVTAVFIQQLKGEQLLCVSMGASAWNQHYLLLLFMTFLCLMLGSYYIKEVIVASIDHQLK